MSAPHYQLRCKDGLHLTPSGQTTTQYVNHLSYAPQEHVVVIGYRGAKAIGSVTVSIGTVDRSAVNIGDIFAAVFALGASKFVLLHNHPSGNLSPTVADVELTEKVGKAADLLKKPLMYHAILSKDAPYVQKIGGPLRKSKLEV